MVTFDANGYHTTRYGNRYTREEWTAFQDGLQAERRIADEFAPKFVAYEQRLRQRLAELGLSEKAAAFVVAHWYEIEEMEETGRVAFSSPERRAAIMALLDKYGKAHEELCKAQESAIEDAKEVIYRKVRDEE